MIPTEKINLVLTKKASNMNDNNASISLREKERQLFDVWQSRVDRFIADGVVNEKQFLQQKCRYVFVLKEANDLNMSLVDFLKSGAPGNGGHTWNPVCRWLTGKETCRFSPEERAEILKRVAVMNLKKSDREPDGNYTTNLGTLKEVVKRDHELIRQQLEIYAQYPPVVFVCCGPWLLTMLRDYVFSQATIQYEAALPFMKPDSNQEIFLVAFFHPMLRNQVS